MAGPGNWSGVFNWPIIGIHAVLTPDNKILTYGTDQFGSQGAFILYDVWDYKTGKHTTLPNKTPTDMFCSAAAIIPVTGEVLILGGDARMHGAQNAGVHDVNVYDPATMTISALAGGAMGHGADWGPMNYERWYPTVVTLANGKLATMGGWDGNFQGVGTPELFDPHAGWKVLPGAESEIIANDSWYPRAWLAGDGDIIMFQANGANQLMRMDPSGSGTLTQIGNPPFLTDWSHPAVMFEQNKVLIQAMGGAAWVMDISGDQPKFTQVSGPNANRIWSNMVVLADGTVMVSGGSGSYNQLIDVDNDVQIWNPRTGQWTMGDEAAIPRLYHSTTILLPDATVLSLGGGAPGPLINLNGEIYRPSYLFNADGTPAKRPVITDAPDQIAHHETFTITVDNAGAIDRLTLVKYGAVTHSLNMGTAKIELKFTVGPNNTLKIQAPDNANILTPGEWMLFALNKKGTPSMAAQVHVDVGGEAYSDQASGFLTLNGSAEVGADGHTFALTQGAQDVGAVMSNGMLDVKSDFELSFDAFLGAPGHGQGIAVVLHADPFGGDATGRAFGNLGARGIKNGVGIELDTYNSGKAYGDIAGTHTNFFKTDGPLSAATNYSVPHSAGNIVDGEWHNVHITWESASHILTYWIDGEKAGILRTDLQHTFLDGSPHAYFGFTGSAGNLGSYQAIRIQGLDAVTGDDMSEHNPGHMGMGEDRAGSPDSDTCFGTGASEVLSGFGGNDKIWANGGRDTVFGGSGNDTCHGGFGKDEIYGGAGADTLSGDAGADYLCGGAGRDHLYGGAGNDTFGFSLGYGRDFVDGGAGRDTINLSECLTTHVVSLERGIVKSVNGASLVISSIERVIGSAAGDRLNGSDDADRLEGRGGNDFLFGSAGRDILLGGDGSDVLRGGEGRDLLRGDAGQDTFRFDARLGAANVDVIRDFTSGLDRIALDNAIFAKLGKAGPLSASEFFAGKHAHDGNDYLIYNRSKGALYFDEDGSGAKAAVQFATLSNHAALSHSDFFVL